MKKVLVILLSVVMFVLSSNVSIAADSDDISTVINALPILQTLGIVEEEYNESNIDVSKYVTRADFAVYFMKLINVGDYTPTALYYNDLPKTHYAYNEITILTEQGYLHGVGDKKFIPDAIISKESAFTVIVRALTKGVGNDVADSILHRYLDIKKGTSSNSDLTVGDLFIMMYNALSENALDITGIKGDNTVFTDNDTFLYKTRNMVYKKRGRVIGVDQTHLYGNNIYENEIIIDDVVINTEGKIDPYLLGKKVDYIYRTDRKEEENYLVYIAESASDDTETYFVEEPEFDAVTWNLSFWENDNKIHKEIIPRDAIIVCNGAIMNSGISDLLNSDKYKLSLISNEKTNDIVIVEKYNNIVVSAVDTDDYIVYDINGNEYDFNSDSYDVMNLQTADGNETKISEIKEKNIISIYGTADNSRLKAIVSKNTVSGSLNSIDDEGTVEVDGKKYKVYDKNAPFDFNGAKTVTLYLDCMGYIAYRDLSYVDANTFVGYAYNAIVSDDIDENLVFKVLHENGEIVRLSTDDNFRIDGTKYTDLQAARDVFGQTPNGKFKPQLLLFKLNSEGKIRQIFIADDNGGKQKVLLKNKVANSTYNTQTGWYAEAISSTGNIGLEMLYNSATKVFNVPGDDEIISASDKKFSVSLPQAKQYFYQAVSYKVTQDEIFYEQYIVNKQAYSTDIKAESAFVMVDSFHVGLNEDDEVLTFLEGMRQGNKIEYAINLEDETDDISNYDLTKGDIIQIAVVDNEIVRLKKIYDTDNFAGSVSLSPEANSAEVRYFSGYVLSKSGTALSVGHKNDVDFSQMLELKNSANIITVYDKEDNRVYKGSVNDIKSKKQYGKASLIIVQTKWGENVSVYVINE